ncbi:MAG: TonB-dependent siderophore receptor [Gemmatimonadota bacterium]
MKRLVLFGALLFLAPAPLLAQTGTVEGRVYTVPSLEPLAGVEIVLPDADRQTVSGESGQFSFEDVPSGQQTILVRHIGYTPQERVVQVKIGQTVRLEVELDEQAIELSRINVVGRRGGLVAIGEAEITRTDAPLADLSRSVSVITDAQLAQQDIGTIAEATRYTPGIRSERWGFEPRLTFIQIRGFDATTTGLYRDGLQLRNPGFAVGYNLEPYGAERIEVLRGPASVLYGAGSPGGLVNYVTKKPTSVPIRELELEGGSFDRVQGKLDLSGPLGEDFGYRLTGLVRDAGTQVDFVQNDRVFFAPTFTWEPGERTSITLLGHYKDDESRASQALPASGLLSPNPNGEIPVDRFTGEPDVDRYARTDYTAGYIVRHGLSDVLTLRQNLRYYDIELDDITVFTMGLREDQRTIDRALFESFGEADGLAIDNQAQVDVTTGSVGHSISGGLDFQTVDAASTQTFGGAPPLDIFDPQYGQMVPDAPVFLDNATDQRQLGVYLSDHIEIDERWIVSLAGRHDWARTEVADNLAGGSTTQEDEAFTFQSGVLYESAIGLAPYASYAESFLPALGTDDSGDPFNPERGRQWEVGLKYEPSDWNGLFTVALFDLTRDDFLQFDPETFLQVQTGQIVSRGVEVEAVAGLASGLDLLASFTYLDSEITETSNPAELGMRPTQTPESWGSVWLDYTLPPGPLGGLGVGGGVRYVGSTYGDAANTLEVPSATLADATVSYDWRDFRLSINVQNVFDNEYVAAAFLRNTPLATYGPARTVTAGLRYRW